MITIGVGLKYVATSLPKHEDFLHRFCNSSVSGNTNRLVSVLLWHCTTVSDIRTNSADCLNSHRWLGRALGTFFIYRAEQHEQKERQVTDHIRILFQELDKGKTKIIAGHLLAISTLQKCRYEKQIIQHLFTGHNEIYKLLISVVDSDKRAKKLYRELITKLDNKVKIEADSLHITNYNNAYNISPHIITHNGTDAFQVEVRNDGTCWVRSGELAPFASCQTKELADSFVSRLNIIAHDPEISKEVESYKVLEKQTRDNNKGLGEMLEDLINGILSGKNLNIKNEACDVCIEDHQKDVTKLKSDLVKLRLDFPDGNVKLSVILDWRELP